MKVNVISTNEEVRDRYYQSTRDGYLTFVYDHADTHRHLGLPKFLYVFTDRELSEKVKLVKRDVSVASMLFM